MAAICCREGFMMKMDAGETKGDTRSSQAVLGSRYEYAPTHASGT